MFSFVYKKPEEKEKAKTTTSTSSTARKDAELKKADIYEPDKNKQSYCQIKIMAQCTAEKHKQKQSLCRWYKPKSDKNDSCLFFKNGRVWGIRPNHCDNYMAQREACKPIKENKKEEKNGEQHTYANVDTDEIIEEEMKEANGGVAV